jgi:hypothetical protein
VVVASRARFAPAGIAAEKLEAGRSIADLGKPGRSTLLLGPPCSEPYRIFRAFCRGGAGMVMSGRAPGRLRERYGLGDARLLWLTSLSGTRENVLGPQDLEYEVLGTAMRHLKGHPGGTVMLDDLDYLSSQVGFDALARFVKGVSDASSELGGSFLAVADPDSFPDRQTLSLAECFDGVRLLRDGPAPPARAEGAILVRHGTYLMHRFGPEAYRALGAISAVHRTLCLTTLPPAKLRERYGLPAVDFIWLSDAAAGPGVMRPRELGYSAQQAAVRHLKSGTGDVVYIDGLERLAPYAAFPEIVRFVKCLADASGEHGGILLASVHPGFFGRAEEAMIKKRFESTLA